MEHLVKSLKDQEPLEFADAEELARDEFVGVYQIWVDDALVYVGEGENLKRRLKEHSKRVRGRLRLDGRVACKFVILPEPWDRKVSESALISYYRTIPEIGSPLEWNKGGALTGFGTKSPTGRRAQNEAPSKWDATYPIDEKFPVNIALNREHTVQSVLSVVKRELPFPFRHGPETDEGVLDEAHRADLARVVPLYDLPLGQPVSLAPLLERVRGVLTASWQLTQFPFAMTLYDGRPTAYAKARGRPLWNTP